MDLIPSWLKRNKQTPLRFDNPPPSSKQKVPASGPLPSGRKSVPSNDNYFAALSLGKNVLPPAWYLPIIPYIRRLTQDNPDLGQALNNTVALGNTGHDILFDPAVGPAEVLKMRQHIASRQDDWSSGVAGMDGLVNRMISQAMVSGALANEWVPNPELTGVESVILINPEEIRFKLNNRKTKYDPYQAPLTMKGTYDAGNPAGMVKLNTNTFKYYALNGDGEVPYGCPPYLASLRAIKTQKVMLDNIEFIINQLGIMGFIEILIEKPEQAGSESVADYATRLDQRLLEAKNRLKDGLADGAVVGYKDSHEINFNSISRDYEGVTKLFEQNELLLASGLNTDASLLGRGYSTSETQITIVFTKLLSELKNIQNLVKHNLEFGYAFELRLAGFKFNSLKVRFKRSTLQDELKYQQAYEIKQRVLHALRVDGIITQNQYAHEMDYEEPAEQEPIVPFDQQAGNSTAQDAKNLNDKNASERKTTDKKKPQGTNNPK